MRPDHGVHGSLARAHADAGGRAPRRAIRRGRAGHVCGPRRDRCRAAWRAVEPGGVELRRGDRPMIDPRVVIAAKRDGRRLEPDELRGFVLRYGRGEVPDYQAAAWLMAAYIHG